jgi:hypothetical protein
MTPRNDICPVGILGRRFSRSGGKHGRNDPAIGQDAKKLLAAGVAAIGRKTEEALQKDQGALLDPVAGDMFQFEIATARAVDVAHEGERDGPGVKPLVARLTSPGPQAHQRGKEVGDSSATGTQAIRTPAPGADHFAGFARIMARQHIQNDLPGQEPWKRPAPRTV